MGKNVLFMIVSLHLNSQDLQQHKVTLKKSDSNPIRRFVVISHIPAAVGSQRDCQYRVAIRVLLTVGNQLHMN